MRKTYPFLFKAFFFSLFVFPMGLFAQDMATFQLQLGLPNEEFAQNVTSPAGGIYMGYLRNIKGTPISLGGAFGMNMYGIKNWEGTQFVGENGQPAQHSISSGIFDLDAKVRIAPNFCPIFQPYGEAFVGGSLLTTEYSIYNEDANGCNSPEYEEMLNASVTYTYGVGGGLMVCLSRKGACGPAFLDLGLSYRNSGITRYMFTDVDESFRTRTQMYIARAGITLKVN